MRVEAQKGEKGKVGAMVLKIEKSRVIQTFVEIEHESEGTEEREAVVAIKTLRPRKGKKIKLKKLKTRWGNRLPSGVYFRSCGKSFEHKIPKNMQFRAPPLTSTNSGSGSALCSSSLTILISFFSLNSLSSS